MERTRGEIVSQYCLQIVLRMFLNPGDTLLCEEYTYPHVPESMLSPLHIKTVPIHVDNEGLVPEHLEASLNEMQARGEALPKLLYTVPVGQNPTGECVFCRQLLLLQLL